MHYIRTHQRGYELHDNRAYLPISMIAVDTPLLRGTGEAVVTAYGYGISCAGPALWRWRKHAVFPAGRYRIKI